MVKIGDMVRYLNAVGGGRVVRIKDNMAFVDDEGFETPALIRELVVVRSAEEMAAAAPKPRENVVAPKPIEPVPTKSVDPEPEPEPVEETPDGDSINVMLAFEAMELKHISDTAYDCFLVNDSNYFLYFTLLSRADGYDGWTARYAGVVEPNFQVLLGNFSRDDVGRFDRLAVQYMAFKRDKEFEMKKPESVEIKVDTTKFFKLHCFRPNVYFETPVLAFDIVRDDKPVRPEVMPNPEKVRDELLRKKNMDRKPVQRRVSKPKLSPGEPLVIDLHITELIDNTRGLSNADMLNLQVDKFREVMDANLKNHGQKIVFIHGKGEGVLRNALMKELNHRYKNHDVQDASFREYGFGATQVTIR